MLYASVLTQLMLFRTTLAIVAQTCIWPDGSLAWNFLPCGNSSVTTGSCCLNGEACLSSGLCYGSLGLVYRGACINTWGGDCPTYCDDIAGNWANLLPCPFANTGSADGPQSFWCGIDGTTACVAANNTHFITVVPGVATKLFISSSTSTTSTSSKSISSSTGTSTKSSSSTSTNGAAAVTSGAASTTSTSAASSSSDNGMAIGLGVGLGVVVLACCGTGYWAFRSYRKQKKQLNLLTVSAMQQGYQQGPGAPPVVYEQPKDYVYTGLREADSGARRPTELAGNVAELGGR